MKYQISPEYRTKLDNFVKNIRDYFNKNKDTIHKARNELKIIPFGEISTVVKAFKIPNFVNKIAYTFFRDSKAKKSYEYSLKLGDFTPKPIAYIEFFKAGLIDESYFISENFTYDFTIREPLLDTTFPDREVLFKAFVHFTLKLHNAGIFHNDYSPGNILIKKSENDYIFKIVDVNRMKFISLNETMRAQNFAKLWAHDEILELMAEEYSKHYLCSQDFKQKVLYYSNKNKNFKNFKKKLKGKPVND